MASKRARVVRLQRDSMGRRDGDFAFQLGEFLVEVDADLLEVPVEAEPVARGDGRRAARPPSLDEDHALIGLERLHGREHEADLPDVEEEAGPLDGIDDAESRPERPEFPAGLEDRDGEPAREPGRGGRASGSAPDDDGAFHPRPVLGPRTARQESCPSVSLRENRSSPPPASPVRIPRSSEEMNPQTSGV